jgi:UDP-glucose 4-epimerase
MVVAVTGAGGFIGRHLARELRARGHAVVAIVRPGSRVTGVDGVIEHDLRGIETLATALRDAGVGAVCHLAWVGHPRSAGMDYEAQLVGNVVPSANVMLASGLAGVGHVVFVSSGGAVADPDQHPRPAYGWAKLAVEALSEATSLEFGTSLTIMRPTALMGPGQDPTRGLGAVTIFARQVLRGEPIRIFGSPAGGRDFLHVADLAECMALVLERGATGVFEAGGPELVTLAGLVAQVEQATGRQAVVEVVGGTGIDPVTVRLDNGPIGRAIGWIPRRTLAASLPEILGDIAAEFERDAASPRRSPDEEAQGRLSETEADR